MWRASSQEKENKKEKKQKEMEVCCYVENKSWKTTLGFVLSHVKSQLLH